jgi:hypothetical protein
MIARFSPNNKGDKVQGDTDFFVVCTFMGWGMATIVTVHGTFSSGPESGEKWWQKGGPLENELRSQVEGEDGRLDFVPHVWVGLNSETSRRPAGAALLKRLVGFEKNGERYCLVGHSHGGSVIPSGLAFAAYGRRTLPGLSNWITVGTPFINFDRKAFLFFNLGLLGKAAYLSAFTFTCLWSLVFLQDLIALGSGELRTWQKPGEIFEAIGAIGGFLLLTLAPFLLIHTLMRWRADADSESYRVFKKANLIGKFLFSPIGAMGRSIYSMGIVAFLAYGLFAVAGPTSDYDRLNHVVYAIIASSVSTFSWF